MSKYVMLPVDFFSKEETKYFLRIQVMCKIIGLILDNGGIIKLSERKLSGLFHSKITTCHRAVYALIKDGIIRRNLDGSLELIVDVVEKEETDNE